MGKHTEGPWIRDKLRIKGPSNEQIAVVYAPAERGTRFANARLIAAAPELLEACERYAFEADENACTCDAGIGPKVNECRGTCAPSLIRAAIAKATGQD